MSAGSSRWRPPARTMGRFAASPPHRQVAYGECVRARAKRGSSRRSGEREGGWIESARLIGLCRKAAQHLFAFSFSFSFSSFSSSFLRAASMRAALQIAIWDLRSSRLVSRWKAHHDQVTQVRRPVALVGSGVRLCALRHSSATDVAAACRAVRTRKAAASLCAQSEALPDSIGSDSAAQVCFGDVNGLPRLFSTGMDGYIRTFSTEGYEMYSRYIRLRRLCFGACA